MLHCGLFGKLQSLTVHRVIGGSKESLGECRAKVSNLVHKGSLLDLVVMPRIGSTMDRWIG